MVEHLLLLEIAAFLDGWNHIALIFLQVSARKPSVVNKGRLVEPLRSYTEVWGLRFLAIRALLFISPSNVLLSHWFCAIVALDAKVTALGSRELLLNLNRCVAFVKDPIHGDPPKDFRSRRVWILDSYTGVPKLQCTHLDRLIDSILENLSGVRSVSVPWLKLPLRGSRSETWSFEVAPPPPNIGLTSFVIF